MLEKIYQNSKKSAKVLVITPLRPEDKISRETKVSLKRNETPFVWFSYKGDGNVMQNFWDGLLEVEKEITLPKYTIKADNDTSWNRGTLDKLHNTLSNSSSHVAYSYCSFEYTGAVNAKFPAIPFDGNKLKRGNYISSNSLFKTKLLKEIPLVVDNYYMRLLDWAYYLKLANNGYIGVPSDGYFIAKASKDSVSNKGVEDYKLKLERVKKDFT